MKKILEDIPQHQYTLSQIQLFINQKTKHKNTSSLITRQTSSKQFQIKPPYYVRQKFYKTKHSFYHQRNNKYFSQIPKKQSFLKRNQSISRFDMIKNTNKLRKKIILQNNKTDKKQTKHQYFQKKPKSCLKLCGLFKISCKNCKPKLDCFNVEYEKFLKENNLWQLSRFKESVQNQEKLKKFIVLQIIDIYQNKGDMMRFQDGKNIYSYQKKLISLIKQKILQKMKKQKSRKEYQVQILKWFYKIHNHFRKEFHKKESHFFKQQKGRKTFEGRLLKEQQKIKSKKRIQRNSNFSIKFNKKRQNISYKLKQKSKIKKINDPTKKIKQKQRQFLYNESDIYNKSSQNSQNKKILDKPKSFKKLSQQIDIFKFKNNNQIKSSFYSQQQKSSKKIFLKQSRTVKKKKTKFQFYQQQSYQMQQPLDVGQIFPNKTRKVKNRRDGMIGKQNICTQEIQLRKYRRKVVNNSVIIEKVQKYLKQCKLDKLRYFQNDSVFTLARKRRFLSSLKVQPSLSQNIKKYQKFIQAKIDTKLQNTIKGLYQTSSQSLQIEQFLSNIIQHSEVDKKLYFYDLFEVNNQKIVEDTFQNINYIKNLYIEKIYKHKITKVNDFDQKDFTSLHKLQKQQGQKIQRFDVLLQKGIDDFQNEQIIKRRKSTQS